MISLKILLAALLLLSLFHATAFADEASRGPKNGWDGAFLDYERPAALVVEESTPDAALIDWRLRPAKLSPEAAAPVSSTKPATPRTAGGMNVVRLRIRNIDGEDVPMLLATPANQKGPFPVAIALHGLNSHKAQVLAQVGPALVRRGFAVLAPDLPMHGERPGESRLIFDRTNVFDFIKRCRMAVRDVRQCIDVAESRRDLDTKRGVVLVGYSMGAIFNSVIGPADPRVQAMVLMVGGANEFPPALALLPQAAALQPLLAVPHFAGRPLLMLNGKADPIITTVMGERLFNAAAEPKKQVWYDSGHLLPEEAYDYAADWIKTVWQSRASSN